MKKTLILGINALYLLVFSATALAVVKEVPQESLIPDNSQRQTALILNRVLERYHYRKVPLDDKLSEKILNRYLEALDPNKSFFTQADIDGFSHYRHELDDAISSGRLEPAFEIFRRFRQRVDQRVDLALKLLKENKFDFTRKETYRFDREDAPWAKNETQIEDQWRKRVKNDILGLRLAGKDDKKIRETLEKRYTTMRRRVHQLDAGSAFQTFVNAYALSIEPHTSYMSPERSENFDISMRLSLQGIGAVLRSDDEYTVIQKVVPGGPADKSGQLHAGDKIVGVGQGEKGEVEDIIGWPLQDVVEKIRGKKDTLVRLNVLPKAAGASAPVKTVVIQRDKIKLEDQAAKSSIIEADGMRFGVIDLPAFYRDFRGQAAGEKDFRSTTRDVRKLIDKLVKDHVDGIIVDLRNNGGGSLTEATELTGLFIPHGPVVQVKDSQGHIDVERDSDPEEAYTGPLAVLVNRNSASASEIFAAAIQDYGRGLIIGEPTFGKGTVQSLVDLGQFSRHKQDLGRLRLTIAQFFRVRGGSTQHKGVIPDVQFPTAEGSGKHGESSLDNALPWASIKPAEYHPVSKAPQLAMLQHKHEVRVAKDPGFNFLVEQNQEINRMEARKEVSLVEAERKKEWDEREQRALERHNKLRALRGLPPLSKLDDDDEDEFAEKEDDPEGINRIMQEEAAHILADYIRQQQPVTAQAD
ncbi:carboxy terminal-processing peptidase [Thiolapillus brandeum]|uniref:Carboxyl-terminal processing protease n=1 Tax=Thiolapillus brandeum TaxID=1076588 RepID=A0A7U6GK95_9GAMM|nr:carboxy terminal-processing peptidase [Thiolapillus brandeum]BAO45170.1 carboxyl-terminal processing protease [Thiolapillus brandeum]